MSGRRLHGRWERATAYVYVLYGGGKGVSPGNSMRGPTPEDLLKISDATGLGEASFLLGLCQQGPLFVTDLPLRTIARPQRFLRRRAAQRPSKP